MTQADSVHSTPRTDSREQTLASDDPIFAAIDAYRQADRSVKLSTGKSQTSSAAGLAPPTER
jgi:hypothetical protein